MKGWGGLMAILEAKNPAGADQVKAHVKATACPTVAAAMRTAPFAPLQTGNPTKIPPREWLYGWNTVSVRCSRP